MWHDGTDERVITLASLEADLPMVQIRTNTYWAEETADYQGVLMRDLVAHLGAADAAALRIRAIDSYVIVMPREDWTSWNVIIATRRNGDPISRRERGPCRLIYPADEIPASMDLEISAREIWMISDIEVLPTN